MIPKSRAYSFRTQIVGGLAPAGDSVEVADIEIFPELGGHNVTGAKAYAHKEGEG